MKKRTDAADKATRGFDNSFRSSAFYNFFRSHRKVESSFSNGLSGTLIHSKRVYDGVKYFKNAFARSSEKSFLVNGARALFEKLLLCSFRTFTGILIYFSIYSLVVNVAKLSFGPISQSVISDTYTSVLLLILALIMIPLKLSVKDMISNSMILSKISDALFVKVNYTQSCDQHSQRTHNGAVMLIGTFLGLLTAIIPSKTILGFIIILFLIFSFFKTPENSVPVLLLAVIFCSAEVLAILSFSSFVAFAFKALRGKRSFNINYFDLLFILFAIILFFAGFDFSKKPIDNSYVLRIMSYCSVYFVFRNCIKNDQHREKCINSIVLCSVLSSLTILYSRIITSGYIDQFAVTSHLDSSIVIKDLYAPAGFVLMTFPFVLSLFSKAGYRKNKITALISIVLSVTSVIIIGNKGLLFALAVCILVYIAASFRNPLTSLLTLLIVYAIMSVLLSNAAFLGADRFFSISDYSENISKTITQIIADNPFSGIGIGPNRFSDVFSAYTHYGENTISYSNNIFLHFLVSFGLFGFLYFIYCLINYFKMQFTSISENRNKNKYGKIISVASVSSVATVIIRGLADYPLSDHRIVFILFVIIGLSTSIYYRTDNNAVLQSEE